MAYAWKVRQSLELHCCCRVSLGIGKTADFSRYSRLVRLGYRVSGKAVTFCLSISAYGAMLR